MSLVNEALKKARIEATQRQAEIHAASSQKPSPRLYVPSSRPLRIGLAVALIATLILALFYLTLLHVVYNPVASASFLPSAHAAPVVQLRVSMPALPLPLTTAAPAAAPAPQTQLAPKDDTVAETPRMTPADIIRNSTSDYETAIQSFQPPLPPPLVNSKTYIQFVDLVGGSKLSLDGILWTEKNPVAIINGITAGPGDDLGSATVLIIEPKRVKLRAEGKDFFIRLP